MKRAISVTELLKMKFEELEFEGPFLSLIGKPEPTGVWIIWGHSGNGKTSFCLQLAKYISSFKRTAYDTLEEGARASFQRAAVENGLRSAASKLVFLDRESIHELKERMAKHKSPSVWFIDSIQYTGMSKAEYIELKEFAIKHKKLLIFNSHARGKKPEGTLAEFVRYDADVKIHIEGFKAFATSRYGGNRQGYVIYEEGASEYWG